MIETAFPICIEDKILFKMRKEKRREATEQEQQVLDRQRVEKESFKSMRWNARSSS